MPARIRERGEGKAEERGEGRMAVNVRKARSQSGRNNGNLSFYSHPIAVPLLTRAICCIVDLGKLTPVSLVECTHLYSSDGYWQSYEYQFVNNCQPSSSSYASTLLVYT